MALVACDDCGKLRESAVLIATERGSRVCRDCDRLGRLKDSRWKIWLLAGVAVIGGLVLFGQHNGGSHAKNETAFVPVNVQHSVTAPLPEDDSNIPAGSTLPQALTSVSDNAITETVRVVDGQPPQTIKMNEVPLSDTVRGQFMAELSNDNYSCSSIEKAYVMVSSTVDAGLGKITCADGNSYQFTSLNNRVFAKPWSGIMLGK